jgi:hypothetical protein
MPILQPGQRRRRHPRTLVSWLWVAAVVLAAVIALAALTHI